MFAPAFPSSPGRWPRAWTARSPPATGRHDGSLARPPVPMSIGSGPPPTPSWSERGRRSWTIPRSRSGTADTGGVPPSGSWWTPEDGSRRVAICSTLPRRPWWPPPAWPPGSARRPGGPGELRSSSTSPRAGGPTLAWSMVEDRAVDKVVVYLAPRLIGGQDAPGVLGGRGFAPIGQAMHLSIASIDRVGEDLRVEAHVHRDR